jgi:hypothetical protein
MRPPLSQGRHRDLGRGYAETLLGLRAKYWVTRVTTSQKVTI